MPAEDYVRRKKMKIQQDQQYEVYTYNILWGTAEKCFEVSQLHKDDEKYHYLTAMLMIYFAFEALLNNMISTLDPLAWKNERQLFSGPPYQGTLGKYKYLIEKLSMASPDHASRPYQTLKFLQQVRDRAVHAKPERSIRKIKVAPGQFPESYTSWLGKHSTLSHVKKCFEDIRTISTSLYKVARKTHRNQFHSLDPFRGDYGYSVTSHK